MSLALSIIKHKCPQKIKIATELISTLTLMGYGHRERAEFCAKCVDQDGKFLKTFEETQKRGRLDVEQLVLKAADHAKIARPPQIGNSSIGGKSRGQLASFFPKWLTSIFS